MTFEIALTGLNAASSELNTISNNIANNATTGFKRSEVEFADVYPVSTLGASKNASGQGVTVSEIRQDFDPGDLKFTENNLDLAIGGQGFFQVSDGGKALYTRAGTFGLDREGFITTPAGHRLTGYTTNEDDIVQPIIDELQVDFSDLRPKLTENVDLSMNLNSTADALAPFDADDPSTYNYSTSTTIYDSLGTSQTSTIYLHKDTASSWSSYLFVDGIEVSQPGGDELGFDTDGKLQTVNGAPGTSFTTTTFTPLSDASPMSVNFELAALTQFDSPFGTNQIAQDGYSAGRLDDFDVDADGFIFGRFSNGQSRVMGQVTLTNFANTQGLQQQGNNNWAESYASGEPTTGAPGSASLGLLQSGALEGSNVDVTEELVAMIGAQRSFQANAQVITTGDSLTQTVINIRR